MKRQLGKEIFAFLLVLVLVGLPFFGCENPINPDEADNSGSSPDAPSDPSEPDDPLVIDRSAQAIWGTWVRMDTGESYYFSSSRLTITDSSGHEETYDFSGSTDTSISADGMTFSIETNNVLKAGSIRLFREGGASRSFTARVAGFQDSIGSRSMSVPGQGTLVRRRNPRNVNDAQDATTDTDGTVEFSEAVAGDPQEITVEVETVGGETVEAVLEATPQYDGEFIGTIPLVETGYNFKTTYTVDESQLENGYMYGGGYDTYQMYIHLQNIGEEDASTSYYEITLPDGLSTTESLSGNMSTIAPNSSRSIYLPLSVGGISGDYEDKTIIIEITDSETMRTWEDYVVLRFYRLPVLFRVRAYNIDGGGSLKGFAITPENRSVSFEVPHSSSRTIVLPYRSEPYRLAFSGAGHQNEMKYSLGVGGTAPNQVGGETWTLEQIVRFKDHNSEANPYSITNLTEATDGYLRVGDINFFSIDLSSLASREFQPVVMHQYEFLSTGNGDDATNPGETVRMDIRVQNAGGTAKSIGAVLSSQSTNISFSGGVSSYSYGNVPGGWYASIGSDGDSYEDSQYADLRPFANNSFRFTIAPGTPAGGIFLTATLSDGTGRSWTEEIPISVEESGANLEYFGHALSEISGNGDGNADPGETLVMDLAVYNSGTSNAYNVATVISSSSPCVETIYDDTATIAPSAGRYSTASGPGYDNSEDIIYYPGSSIYRFKLSDVAEPAMEIPLTLTMTGSYGTWSDTFSVTVHAEQVEAPVFSPGAGTYTSSRSVVISSGTLEAEIYYTTDGSIPTNSTATRYSGPINVDVSQNLRAIAVKDYMVGSEVSEAAYTITGTVAAPQFSVNGGTYTTEQEVSLSTIPSDATIRYTTNGDDPTSTTGTVYTGPLTVSSPQTVKAIAYKTDWAPSTVASEAYNITGTVADPAFTVDGGTYTSEQTVSLSTVPVDATIRYTTNGDDPTLTSGTIYSGPIGVSTSQTLKAIAFKADWETSAVSSADYVLQVEAPTSVPPAGVYTSSQSVSLNTVTDGASIRYTIDGSVPDSDTGTLYTGSFPVSSSQTIKAVAFKTGWNPSEVSEASYTITGTVDDPILSPGTGTYTSEQSVTITSSTPDASIRYTINGDDPTSSSGTIYTGPVTIDASRTVKAIAYKLNWADSSVNSAEYTLEVADPEIAPTSGTFSDVQSVSISAGTAGASIRYTTDGSTPTSSAGTIYSAPFTLTESKTVRAVAYRSGWTSSGVIVSTITMKAADPVISPAGGTFNNDQQVTISSASPDVSIRYTTDGSDPSSAVGTIYTAPFTLGEDTTVRAIAYRSGWSGSEISQTSYSFVAADPVVTVPAEYANPQTGYSSFWWDYIPEGTYVVPIEIELSTGTTGASIYYTLDDTDPSQSNGTLYSAPISIPSTDSIRAVTVKNGYGDSSIINETFTITGTVEDPVFTPASGTYAYDSGLSVSISTATPDGLIRYSTTGEPGRVLYSTTEWASDLLESDLPIMFSQTVYAKAHKQGWADSNCVSESYTITGPAGGIVVYDKGQYTDGWRYLEAAPESEVMEVHPWGGRETTVVGTSGAIGTGLENTNLIVAELGSTEPYAGRSDYAAKLCADFSYGGYDDWFLPSEQELHIVKSKYGFIGGEGFATCWSSTEYNSHMGWIEGTGPSCVVTKDLEYRVWPIRRF